MKRMYYIANCIAYMMVPVAVGWLTGWLVGSSQSPVVATIIPLIFGLLTAIGFGVVGSILRKSSIFGAIRAIDMSEDIKKRIECEIRAGVSHGTALFVSVGVIVFCITFYVGALQGIARRVPTYPPLMETFHNISLEPQETALLYKLRMSLAAKGVTIDNYLAIMNDVLKPILNKKYNEEYGRQNDLRSALNILLNKNGTAAAAFPAPAE
ncbi:MAG: hypothetical protein NTV22_16045 [bacterium]|nr:hypothetical protein [bacterium]